MDLVQLAEENKIKKKKGGGQSFIVERQHKNTRLVAFCEEMTNGIIRSRFAG